MNEPAPRRSLAIPGAAFLAVAAIVVALDQLTKVLIRSTIERGDEWPEGWAVRLVHVTNSGAAFGVLEGQTLFLIVTSLIAIGTIAFYYLYPPADHAFVRVALGLLLGGAIGNLMDRIRSGEVVDFVKFPNFPAFNVADSSISIGVALLFIFSLLSEREEQARTGEQTSAEG
ncbi:MAG: signal peptidase II [Dehalococcoidia bacterium]